MRLDTLKEKTSGLLLLSKNILRNFEPRENILAANIKYWLKNGELIALKNGVYILKDRYSEERNKDSYIEYIANQLIQPSYISAEYVLAKYQLLSEPVNAITSITAKTTREIINPIGAFRYYSMQEPLFNGYQIKSFYNSPVLEAEKSKALFDYLYIHFIKKKSVDNQDIENLRLNWENVKRSEFIKARSYATLINKKNIEKVFKIIKKLYYD